MRRRDERGVAMAEAAIALPLIALLIFGIATGALLMRSYLTIDNAANTGARAASIAGNDVAADYDLLRTIKPALAAVGSNDLEYVVVYRATTFESAPPGQCANGIPVTGSCNVYRLADLNRPQTDFTGGTFAGDDYWPSSARRSTRANPVKIGVYVKAKTGGFAYGMPVPTSLAGKAVVTVETRSY